MSAYMSKDLLNMLTEFYLHEIQSKARYGITYTFLLKNNKTDEETYRRYLKIRQTAYDCGYNEDQIFRIFEVCNGYICDMDLDVACNLMNVMLAQVDKIDGNNEQDRTRELIEQAEQRKRKDLIHLGKYLKNKYDNGEYEIDIALYSRNTTNKILIQGNGKNGERLCLQYNAYAIKYMDIRLLNEKLLIPAGFRVAELTSGEILPSKTGVSFTVGMSKV